MMPPNLLGGGVDGLERNVTKIHESRKFVQMYLYTQYVDIPLKWKVYAKYCRYT